MKTIGRAVLPPHRGLGAGADLVLGRYASGDRIAVMMVEAGEPIATLSVNVPAVRLGDNEFVVKGYSENNGLDEAAFATGLFERTGRTVMVGFAECEVWRLAAASAATVEPAAQSEPVTFGTWEELDLLAVLGRLAIGDLAPGAEAATAVDRAGEYLRSAATARTSPAIVGRRTLSFQAVLGLTCADGDVVTPSVAIELDDMLVTAIFELRALCELKALHDVSACVPVDFDPRIGEELGAEPADGAVCVSRESLWLKFSLGGVQFNSSSVELQELQTWLLSSQDGDTLEAPLRLEEMAH
jgi:hypothetical protein